MSYVMDPFESATNKYFQTVYGGQGAINVTTVDAAFGKSAIQVDYQVVQTETWGGFVDFGRVATRAHNCNGATHMSIWYKVMKPQSAKLRCHLRLVLLDDSDCSYPSNCTVPDELEQFYSFQYVLDDSRADWRELRVELRGDTNSESPFWQTGWAGISGNNALDLQHIRGWRIEMNIDSQGDVGSSSDGCISFDQLACLGGGELFGAALQNPGNGFSDAVAAGKWAEVYNHSAPSKISTTSEFVNKSLVIQYSSNRSVTMKESRSYIHVAPDPAYYNLSQVETISLDYSTTQVAPALTKAGNMAIQMHLMDASACNVAVCEEYHGSNAEQSVAVTARVNATDAATGNATIAMPRKFPSPQKNSFDSSQVKGFSLTVTIGPVEPLVLGVDGQVVLSNLLGHSNATGNNNEVGSTSESTCIIEPNFQFDINQDGVRKMEFVSSKCCQICDSDKDCIYAQSDGMHCYMASRLNSSSVGHTGLVASQDKIRAFWMDDKDKRGDFCEVCECRGVDRTIDCRGRNLPILPKTFTTVDGTWSPLVLDLRDNPSLVLVGLSALEELSSTLQALKLPAEVRHLAYGCFQQLPALKTLTFARNDSSAASTNESLRNTIVESTDFFGNVCCKPGMHIELQSPSSGLTFCNMTPSAPGIDATYEPFIEFFDGKVLATIQRSSTFMSEASKSAELCAEYCAIRDDCRYYAYDGRQSNAEPKCHHLETKGTPTKVCCNSSDDFADANQTKPGWISGLVPKTRNELENARVVAASSNHSLSKTNNYTSNLIFSLGSSPLRGAVWIKPILAADSEFDVSFRPPRVALYDNVSIAVVEVTIFVPLEIKHSGKVHVTTEIESCDAAFVADDILTTTRIMELDVVLEVPSSRNLVAWTTLSFAVVVLVVAAYLYVDHKKRKADAVWIIYPSELAFRDPPEVLGRGTFGLVLLAEYRGTQVAVKRVIPPSCGNLDLTNSVNCSVPLTRRSSYRSESVTLRSSMGRTLRQSSNQLKEEFMAEMRLLSKLRHPCVTTVMGMILDAPCPDWLQI